MFACGPADATAAPSSLASLESRMVFTFLRPAYPGCPGKEVVKRVYYIHPVAASMGCVGIMFFGLSVRLCVRAGGAILHTGLVLNSLVSWCLQSGDRASVSESTTHDAGCSRLERADRMDTAGEGRSLMVDGRLPGSDG